MRTLDTDEEPVIPNGGDMGGATTESVTREMGPLMLRAAVVPSSLDEEARTIDVVWTTGARVMRGFFERYWEELSLDPKHVRMDRLNGGAPLLDSHNGYRLSGVIGVTESARLEKGEGIATVRFARAEDDEDADKIFRKVVDGVIRNVSVGYRVHRLEKVESERGKTPVYRATDWEPYEISMVPMGADAKAGVRADDGAETNPCEFVQERSMTVKKGESNAHQHPTGAGPTAPPAADTATQTEERSVEPDVEARKAERERVTAIQRVARSLDLGDDFAQRHVDAETSLDEFRGLAFDEYERAKPVTVSDAGRAEIVPVEDTRDKWMRGASAWLIARSGLTKRVSEGFETRGEEISLDPGEFRGLTMVDLARQALERAGVRTAGMRKVELIGAALTQRGGGMNSTGDFAVLLESTLHKMLLASYAVTSDTWSRFCKRGSVSDFRPHNRYRLGTFGRLDKVNEHGEFTNKQIPDGEKQSISADTFGNIIAITRQALVNDDLGAFTDLAMRLGQAGRLSIEIDVYALLALNGGLGPAMEDGDTLFHANHNNLGAGSALSVAGLDADATIMAEQTDPSGNEVLDLEPEVLLVPRGLKGQAIATVQAEFDVDQVGGRKPNAVRGLVDDIIGTARLAGTRRYMFAAPGAAPTIEVVFLDGQDEPYIEVQDGWRVDGSELKVRLDYGVGAIDWRGAVTDEGVDGG